MRTPRTCQVHYVQLLNRTREAERVMQRRPQGQRRLKVGIGDECLRERSRTSVGTDFTPQRSHTASMKLGTSGSSKKCSQISLWAGMA